MGFLKLYCSSEVARAGVHATAFVRGTVNCHDLAVAVNR